MSCATDWWRLPFIYLRVERAVRHVDRSSNAAQLLQSIARQTRTAVLVADPCFPDRRTVLRHMFSRMLEV